MQEHYTSEYHMKLVRVIMKLYYNQSEEELGQTVDQFWTEHEKLWYRVGSSQT